MNQAAVWNQHPQKQSDFDKESRDNTGRKCSVKPWHMVASFLIFLCIATIVVGAVFLALGKGQHIFGD